MSPWRMFGRTGPSEHPRGLHTPKAQALGQRNQKTAHQQEAEDKAANRLVQHEINQPPHTGMVRLLVPAVCAVIETSSFYHRPAATRSRRRLMLAAYGHLPSPWMPVPCLKLGYREPVVVTQPLLLPKPLWPSGGFGLP